MRYGENQPGCEWFRGSNGSGELASSGVGRSIRPGTAVPSRMLVSAFRSARFTPSTSQGEVR